jgi:exodeoxyribonuclease VII large subunit
MEFIFSVSEFIEAINQHFSLLGKVTVEGEISQINISQNKWLFISIKDKESTIEVFGVLENIYNYNSFEEGMKIYVTGEPRLYRRSGKFSIYAYKIEPAGEGALKIAFEKLKKKLEDEGLFEITRKRILPQYPQNIGLVTAKNSQAENDFLKVLKHRMGGIKIYYYPVSVQGENSVKQIVRAISYLNRYRKNLDLIALIRGGGSLEDLKAFNDEKVARAIFSSSIPIVSGVGHEKDVTLADLAADLRASTPSNVAELISRDRVEMIKNIDFQLRNIESLLSENTIHISYQVESWINSLSVNFASQSERLNLFLYRIEKHLTKMGQTVDNIVFFINLSVRQIRDNYLNFTEREKLKINSLNRLVQNLDYRSILSRGFAIVKTENGRIIKSAVDLNIGQNIQNIFHHGATLSKIYKINKGNYEEE